ncbi:MAG: hypothetical protein GEU71_02025 [Actinobacteria bacterium]|nr:hypothetical protein [Actinomycetota bacterium]
MSPRIRTEDLIDVYEVAAMLGLAHRNSVTTYLERYEDMPRPIIDFGGGKCRLWLRSEIREWLKSHPQRTPRAKHDD